MEWLLLVTIALASGAVTGGVVSAWMLRERTQDPDVDELIGHVAKLSRTVRRIEMQRVRANPGAATPPPELRDLPTPDVPVLDSKAALRAHVFHRRTGIDRGFPALGATGPARAVDIREAEETPNDASAGARAAELAEVRASSHPDVAGNRRVTAGDAAAGVLDDRADGRVPRRQRTH